MQCHYSKPSFHSKVTKNHERICMADLNIKLKAEFNESVIENSVSFANNLMASGGLGAKPLTTRPEALLCPWTPVGTKPPEPLKARAIVFFISACLFCFRNGPLYNINQWTLIFSALKHIKNYLRSTMSDTRLNELAHLYTNRDKALNYDAVVDEFAKKNRRVQFQWIKQFKIKCCNCKHIQSFWILVLLYYL